MTARILAQQARAEEILGLLKRGSDPLSDIRFDERTAQIGWLLDEHRGRRGGGRTARLDAAPMMRSDAS